MRRLLIALLFGTGLCAPARAQERTLHQKPPDLLRSWPSVGRWDVTLVRDKDGALECQMSTRFEDGGAATPYVLGFDSRNGEMEARMSGNAKAFSMGNKITILIDDTVVGSFPITTRERSVGTDVVEAKIPREYANKIADLLNTGVQIKFATNAATYAAPLDSARVAMVYFGACGTEASRLDAIERDRKGPHGRSALQS